MVLLCFSTVKACKSKNDNWIPANLITTINADLPSSQNNSLASSILDTVIKLDFAIANIALNVVLNKTYMAGSVETDGTQQNKAFDGDTVSHWEPKEPSELEWI